METTKICVINHIEHKVYLLTVDRNTIVEKYHDEEEAFIKEKLGYTDEMFYQDVSWDWFIDIEWLDEPC